MKQSVLAHMSTLSTSDEDWYDFPSTDEDMEFNIAKRTLKYVIGEETEKWVKLNEPQPILHSQREGNFDDTNWD